MLFASIAETYCSSKPKGSQRCKYSQQQNGSIPHREKLPEPATCWTAWKHSL